MTILDWVKKAFVRNIPSPSFNPVMFGGPAVYPDPNSLKYIQQAFSGNGTVYTIVSTAARKFGYIPRYAYRITDESADRQYKSLLKLDPKQKKKIERLQKKAYDETLVSDDFDKLLKQPNQGQGQDAFFELAYVYYMVMGETYIWLNRGLSAEEMEVMDDAEIDAIKPLEMYVLPAHYLRVIPDPNSIWLVGGYELAIDGLVVPIRKNDVIRWVKPNPNTGIYYKYQLRGLSPIQPGNKLLTQDDSGMDAAVAMQQNDGAKGVLFNSSLNNLNAEQESQMRSVISRKINNRDLKGSIAALQGEWGYLDMGKSSTDMQLLEGQEKVFIRICNLFGVPAELFITQNTYDNKDQARRDLITSLILPDACKFRDEMNRVLLPIFYPDPVTRKRMTHDVDVTDLPELQEDMSAKVVSLQQAYWLSPNQKLQAMGEEMSSDPLMDKIWIPNNLVLMEDAGMSTDQIDSYDPSSSAGQGAFNRGGNLSDNNEPPKTGLSPTADGEAQPSKPSV